MPGGALQTGDRAWLPGMLASACPPVILTGIGQRHHVIPGHLGKTQVVATECFLSQYLKAHTLKATCRIGKAQGDHIAVQADGLKNLGTLIGLQR